MENSKLVSVLKTLTKAEFKELEKFIESPYFIKGRDCKPLFKALKSYHPEFKSTGITKKAVFERMYPGKKYGDAKSVSLLSTLSSELYRLCREFLVINGLNEDTFTYDSILLKQLMKKGLDKEFLKEYESASLKNKKEGKGPQDFLNDYLLSDIYENYSQIKLDIKGIMTSMQEGCRSALAFALIRAYQFTLSNENAKTYKIELERDFTQRMLDSLNSEKLLAEMERENDKLYDNVAAAYYVYMMAKEPAEWKHYHKLKVILENSLESFNRYEKFLFYAILGNFVVWNYNQSGLEEFNRELFTIYDKMYRLGIYKHSDNDNIDPYVYRNMVITAMDVNEYDWAEGFINKTSHELPDEEAESVMGLVLARLHFEKKEYEKALKSLINVKHHYNLYKIYLKMMLFVIYYEKGDYEQAISIADTSKHYLASTKEVTDLQRGKYSGFFKYASILVNCTVKDGKDTGIVLDKLKKEKIVEWKHWFVKKLEELGKANKK